MKYVAYIIVVTSWIAGISLAQGFWQTAAAYVFPPYAWVLVAERMIPNAPETHRG